MLPDAEVLMVVPDAEILMVVPDAEILMVVDDDDDHSDCWQNKKEQTCWKAATKASGFCDQTKEAIALLSALGSRQGCLVQC